jgi:amino acid adenylation domain-containing protein
MSPQPNLENGLAIIGLAGRFPKAKNIDEFWRNLQEGVESVSFFTDEELSASGLEPPKNDANYVKARAFLEDADLFDADFFGLNPREAEVIDPQHRVFLECAWEALENAGCDPSRFDGAIGVFAGMSMNTYLAQNLLTRPELMAQLNEHQVMLGNDKDFLTTRVSYKLNLRGPSLNIQTACSTSLVAVCVACQNLLNYECDMALAGAVSITFPQKRAYLYQEGGIASPDGHCRAFDAKAEGTVSGEGVGIVVLKRLEDALADGDAIYAVIKGFAINNDGSNKMGYTAPSVEGQAEVIATAQAMAGFAPESISYIEAHGTGTPLGDPIEIEALTKAFQGGGLTPKNSCAIGSVKSNIGHLDTAAGVAGLIKTALALHHKKIPASLHFESPNPKIEFANSPFYVNGRLAEWKGGNTPRRAGVSSFGFGGTNAHVVLEEGPGQESQGATRPAQLLLLSAKTEAALAKATANLAAHLKQNPAVNMADAAYTLQLGRKAFTHRRMLVCHGQTDAVNALDTLDSKLVFTQSCRQDNPSVVFLFPGQGAQHVNMALDIYKHEPTFREQVDTCCAILSPHLGFDLRTVLYPTANSLVEAEARLTQTALAQPALFVIEYALAKLWLSWGVRPEAMLGHSVGEYVAACLAGVFTLEDALKLIAGRGRMMQQLPGGAMLAVRLPESEVKPYLNDRISLATINAPSLCVVSGPTHDMESVRSELSRRSVPFTGLRTSHAFHSAMMDSILEPFAQLVGKVRLKAPQIPYISNVTGAWISPSQATDPQYWATHLRQTVRFADGVAELCRGHDRILLEVGPGRTLSNLVKQPGPRSPNPISIASLPNPIESISDWQILLNAVGHLWLSGTRMDWKAFYAHERRRRVHLPAYPFDRKRFWVEPAMSMRAQSILPPIQAPERELEKLEASPSPKVSATADELRQLFSELSGLSPAALNGTTTFAEMGLDSLFLTQACVMLERKFGARVLFRQLLEEYSTLDTLASHLEKSPVSGTNKIPATSGKEKKPSAFVEPKHIATIPLTEAQRELWFASQMSDAASCAYNESRLLHLRGALNQNALLEAWRKLVDRHEALRTTLAPDGVAQQVHPGLKLDIPLVDWVRLAPDQHASRLDAVQAEESALPFDLVRGPLLRARLIRLAEEHHVLLLTVHHIICDGHSLGIILRELGETYSAECRGARSELAAPLQLSEFVRWPSRQTAALAADEEFWLKQFVHGAPVLELPADYPRPSTWTYDGAVESRLLPETLGQALKRVGAWHGGTLFTTLLAAYAVFLHKLSSQNEIVIGLPIADRAREGGDTLVGHCVNFLPLPVKLNGATFADFLAGLQREFLDAYDHQHFAFGRLVQKMNLARDASRMPLVSVTLNVQRIGEPLKFFGLKTELQSNPHAYTNFDFGLNVTEISGALQLDCRYNRSLFSASTIRRWLGHFHTLLENITTDPRQSLASLSLLSLEERRRILQDWSGGEADFDCDKPLHQLFEEQATRTPEALAVVFEEQRMSYGELNRHANRLAHCLRALGVDPEAMVGLCLERSIEMIIGMLAILKAGAAYVPMDSNIPAERLEFVLRDTNARVLVTQRALLAKLPPFEQEVVCVEDVLDSQNPCRDNNPGANVRPEHLAYVIYTSGSTGKPKGVQVTHQNIMRLFHATQPWYQFNERDVWTMFHSSAFDFSVWEIWGALIYGGRLVIVPHPVSRSPEDFLALLAREGVTVLNQTPSAFRQLLQADQRSVRPCPLSLRHVIFGGEALEITSLKPWFDKYGDQRPRLVNMYGITETTVHVTYRPVHAKDIGSGSLIGEPIPDLRIYILDAGMQPVPIGVRGEIYVGGAGVARGYLNRPELTAERFIANPFIDGADERLYKTGDLARWLADGDMEYLGRADNQVKIRGHRIELGEIESALLQFPLVRECVVLAHEESRDDKRLVAYLVAEPDQGSPTSRELRRYLNAKLPDYMIPSAFVSLEALPLTPNNKVDHGALAALEQAGPELDESFTYPNTPTESAVAAIWREVLHLERVGVQGNFFELGGHSLLMTQVISRLREAFQIELSIRKFFESPTIAGLAKVIEELLAEEIRELSEEEPRPLVQSRD